VFFAVRWPPALIAEIVVFGVIWHVFSLSWMVSGWFRTVQIAFPAEAWVCLPRRNFLISCLYSSLLYPPYNNPYQGVVKVITIVLLYPNGG
jgi:hypothetical protein